MWKKKPTIKFYYGEGLGNWINPYLPKFSFLDQTTLDSPFSTPHLSCTTKLGQLTHLGLKNITLTLTLTRPNPNHNWFLVFKCHFVDWVCHVAAHLSILYFCAYCIHLHSNTFQLCCWKVSLMIKVLFVSSNCQMEVLLNEKQRPSENNRFNRLGLDLVRVRVINL